ncbi:MAG: RNA ligase RtcB family protein [Clostridia bacterium]|nr:RNA ligase RtcB family protein [Clostridia bacterium]
MNDITIITSQKNWLEQDAVIQLKQIAALPGVVKTAGLPDLHPGKTPVGAAIITEGLIYPHLIGNDIGCGMSYFMTEMERRKVKPDRMVKRLEALQSLKEIDISGVFDTSSLSPLGKSLGTIGGGNHFAELQEVDQLFDKEAFHQLGYDKNRLMLLIHSGSRCYGQSILDEFIRQHSAQKGLIEGSEAFDLYLSKHDDAVNWAKINRDLVAYRMLKALDMETSAVKLIDSIHNSVSPKDMDGRKVFIHRKGAAPADQGAVIIPGSRGTLTYLVLPSSDTSVSSYSVSHGAGRKWERSVCKAKLENKYTKETIRTTKLKGKVICQSNNLLFEEAPEAYKNIDTVIQSMLEYKLIKVVAAFKPVLTYKAST